MTLILIILVCFFLFGGGGYYGMRQGYYGGGGFGQGHVQPAVADACAGQGARVAGGVDDPARHAQPCQAATARTASSVTCCVAPSVSPV